ncbi:MAG: matrixin family metalloprotease [Acidobacteriota bacterium]
MMRLARITLAVAVSLAVALPAFAFRMIQANANGRVTGGNLVACNAAGGFAHWTTLEIGWRINQANQGWPAVGPLRNAIDAWNEVTGDGYVLDYDWTTNNGFATDGINTVLWAPGNGCVGDCLALTALVIQNGQEIIESDITFNNNVTWTNTGANFDRETVLIHELGHSLGIHHSEVASPRPIMRAGYVGKQHFLTNDDREALRCSYDRYHPCTAAPPTPLHISGPDRDLCQGADEQYRTPHIPGAESYRWEVLNHFFSTTSTANYIYLSGWYFQTPGPYSIRVRSQNDCGSSAWRQGTIWVLPNSDPACGGCNGRFCF